MIKSNAPRLWRSILILAVVSITALSSSTGWSQSYVSGDEAISILESQVKFLEEEGEALFQSGQTEEAIVVGYRYRYTSDMLERLSTGTSVPEAVELALPVKEFVVYSASTGDEYLASNSLDQIKTELRNWANTLLTR